MSTCAPGWHRKRGSSTCSPTVPDVLLRHETDFAGWRARSRALVAAGIPPEEITWRTDSQPRDLFVGHTIEVVADGDACSLEGDADELRVPRRFIELVETVICNRDPERFAVLYALLWRIARGEPKLLAIVSDPLVRRAEALAHSVHRDIHKMQAFVRFREVTDEAGLIYVAWFEPQHFIIERAAPFFVRRFASMRWTILTPDRCVFWNGQQLTFGRGAVRGEAPTDDALEDLWRSYYASIFNPARPKLAAMKAQMPVRYWGNLPEAQMIRPLVRRSAARAEAMIGTSTNDAAGWTGSPAAPAALTCTAGSLEALQRQAARCRACSLGAAATQTVFGEGPPSARLMLVGEQPGDQEDARGRPFVGPAGEILDRALRDAGIDRNKVWVTNAVKHFKFIVRGKRRLHQKPNIIEIEACRPWLEAEMDLVHPEMIVALGASASRSLLRRDVRINACRRQFFPLQPDRRAMVTIHPSYLLRLPQTAARAIEYQRFVADLAQVSSLAPM
jgi:uracil-DNA glycosylase